MRIPLLRIIELLDYVHPEVRIDEPDRWLKGVKLLPSDCTGLDNEYLYFCTNSDLIPYAPSLMTVIPKLSDGVQCNSLANCIVLHTDVPIVEIFNEILGFQTMLQAWEMDMERACANQTGIQQLVEQSERVFGNPVVVLDPAYRTLASTQSFQAPDDPVFSELLNQGYLSQETYNLLEQHNYFTPDHHTGETLVLGPSEIKKYTSTLTTLNGNDGTVLFLTLMLFNNLPATPGLLRLYDFFITRINIVLMHDDFLQDSRRTQCECFMADVLDRRCTEPMEIESRGKCFFPQTRTYNVVAISLLQSTELSIKFACNALQSIFPALQPTQYHGSIILLVHLGSQQLKEYEAVNFLPRLYDYLTHANAYAGISNLFTSFACLTQGYKQAMGAQNIGRQLHRESTPYFWYQNYQVYLLLDAAFAQSRPVESMDPRFTALLEHDKTHQTTYEKILECFLRNERNYSNSGKELHMHRNNVIYHIQKIMDKFSLDLNDPDTRLMLQISYKVRELYVNDSDRNTGV